MPTKWVAACVAGAATIGLILGAFLKCSGPLFAFNLNIGSITINQPPAKRARPSLAPVASAIGETAKLFGNLLPHLTPA